MSIDWGFVLTPEFVIETMIAGQMQIAGTNGLFGQG